MRPSSLPPLLLLASACAPSLDLEVVLGADTVAVGEPVEVTLRGVVDAPVNASAYLSVAIHAEDSLDFPEVTFETVSATPLGLADFLDGRSSADNESAPILFSLHDRGEELRARWELVCGTPGEWMVFGSVRLEGSGGAPLNSGNGEIREAFLTCE